MQKVWSLLKANKKESTLFIATFVFAVTFYICVNLHLPIPSPTIIIGNVLEPLVKPIAHWLKGASQ